MVEPTINQKRNWTVAKSNDIVRNTRYSLSVQQQKILLYMISKIRPQDVGNEKYVFDIQEFVKVIGLEMNGFYYMSLKKLIKELRDSSVWIKIDKKEILLSWLNTVEMDEGSGKITISFHESVQPYLFELQNRYVSYRLNEVLLMRSKYSLRLYEILKSFAYGSLYESCEDVRVEYTIQQIRELLDAGNYDRYYNLKARCLQPAIDEINKYSEEIHISMSEKRKGNTVTSIIFSIAYPRGKQINQAHEYKQDKLKGWK